MTSTMTKGCLYLLGNDYGTSWWCYSYVSGFKMMSACRVMLKTQRVKTTKKGWMPDLGWKSDGVSDTIPWRVSAVGNNVQIVSRLAAGEMFSTVVEIKVVVHYYSRCGLAVRRLAGKRKDLGSIRFGSPFSSLQKLWFMDTVLWFCQHK